MLLPHALEWIYRWDFYVICHNLNETIIDIIMIFWVTVSLNFMKDCMKGDIWNFEKQLEPYEFKPIEDNQYDHHERYSFYEGVRDDSRQSSVDLSFVI